MATALVAVDLKTGKMKWYFQIIHHEIWDYDLSRAAAADGYHGRRQADQGRGAEPTKQGYLFVFDRITGKPVWPIVERPVPKGDVPGEWYAPDPAHPRPSPPPTRAPA